jgi:RNA polymerase sigma factor (sigma-70 family)
MDTIKLYEPMMKSIIKKYLEYAGKVGLDYDDLFQEASMTVLQAENTYKDNKGMKLETWIYNNIDWRIQRVLEANKKYEKIISINSTVESGEGSIIEILDMIQDKVNIALEVQDKIMMETYKAEITANLDKKKADVMILKYFYNQNNNYIEKVLNITGISNYVREARTTLIRKSLLFRNEYRRIHHIDDYSNTERLALM